MRLIVGLGIVAGLLGCGEEGSNAPAPPSTGGGGTSTVGGRRDAGRPSDDDSGMDDPADEDAGPSAGIVPLRAECEEFEPVMFVGEDPPVDVVAATTLPVDFMVSRALTTWEDNCRRPQILIELSNGDCTVGRGHALRIWLETTAITDGSIGFGLNQPKPEPNNGGIRIRYTRPAPLTPRGDWGTCTGSLTMLDFTSELGTDRGARLQGRFILDLTPCDGSTNERQMVQGSFNVQLRRGLDDVCPSR
jgi:hypothetical protein